MIRWMDAHRPGLGARKADMQVKSFFVLFLMCRLASFQGEPYVDGIYDVYYVPGTTSAQELLRRPEPNPSPCGNQRRWKAK